MSWTKSEIWQQSFIRQAIDAHKVAHAYLFIGPDQQHKIWVAMGMAKALLCTAVPGAGFCDTCATCRKVENHNHPDVIWVKPSGARREIKIEMARQARAALSLKSYEGGKKIAFLVDADRMNTEAANALLKTIEEPVDNTIIVLIAPDIERFLPTIVSRCQQVHFPLANRESIRSYLSDEHHCTPEKADLFAALSNGNYSSAIRLLDEGYLEWRDFVIDSLIAIFDGKIDPFDLAEHCEQQLLYRARLAMKQVHDVQQNNENEAASLSKVEKDALEKTLYNAEVSEFFQLLELFCRDMIIYKETAKTAFILNIDKIEKFAQLSNAIEHAAMLNIIDEINRACDAYQGNTKLQFVLEVLFGRIHHELVA